MPGRESRAYLRVRDRRTPPGRYPRLVPSTLDAALLTRWARAATQALERHRAEMDRINVFPVADGDTGTNLLLTMRSAADSLRRRSREAAATSGTAGRADPDLAEDLADPDLADAELTDTDADTDTAAGREAAGQEAADAAEPAAVAAALARGALLGARGNSGVILSQVLRGVAEAIGAVAALGVAAVGVAAAAGVRERAVPSGGAVLADALARAARLATAAVSRPREGTVLSVLTSAAGAARATGSDRLDEVAIAAVDAAAHALRATTGQLPELARAGVVDAGGLGVYLVLDALAGLVSGRAAATPPEPVAEPVPARPVVLDGYEVMYLLDAEAPAADALRAALDALGDSVAVVGDGTGTWTVHVHCVEVGPSIEAGIDAGRPHHITVTRFADQAGAGRFTRERAVLMVVTGPEIVALARSAGAAVLERTPDRWVGEGELVAACADTRARHVVLVPGDAALTAVAESAAGAARDAGQEVLVVPVASVLQGLAALAVHDPGRRPGDDVVAMAEAAAGTRTIALRVADTEALTWAGRCAPGNVLGVSDGEVVLIAPDLAAAARQSTHRMLLSGGELVTVLLGEGVDEAVADGLVAELGRTHPEVDVVVHRGGPAGCPVELGVE